VDIVFARDKLLEICNQDERDCIPWEKWDKVLEKVKDLSKEI